MADNAVPHNPVIITACLALAERVDAAWLQMHLIARMLQHPRFASVVKSDTDCKLRFERVPSFTATCAAVNEYHIAVERMFDGCTASWRQRERMFQERLCEIMSTPLDATRPLWKMHLFPGWSIASEAQEEEEGCMIVVRVHHSISDGVGLVKYFAAQVIDNEKQTKLSQLLVVPEWQKARLGLDNTSQRAKRSQSATAEQPVSAKARAINARTPSFAHRVREAIEDVYLGSVRMLFREPESAFTRSAIQAQKTCALLPPSERFSVSKLKSASHALGITLNDLLYAALAGACRKYLQRSGDSVDLLKWLRCGIPFNRHIFDTLSVTDISNDIAIVPICLHVDEEDRMVRLEKCVEALRRVKRGWQPGVMLCMLCVAARLWKKWRVRLWRRLSRSVSLLFTNVAGPRESVSIGGIDVKWMHFFAPADGHVGVVVGLFSYMGKIAVGVAGDKERISDPELFVGLLGEEIEALLETSKT